MYVYGASDNYRLNNIAVDDIIRRPILHCHNTSLVSALL
jgi:hypothetical protein